MGICTHLTKIQTYLAYTYLVPTDYKPKPIQRFITNNFFHGSHNLNSTGIVKFNHLFQYVDQEDTLKYLDGLTTHWAKYGQNLHPSVNEFAYSDKKSLFLLASETGKKLICHSNNTKN